MKNNKKSFNVFKLIGMKEKSAINLAKKNGFIVILPGMVVSSVFVPNRLSFKVDKNGIVSEVNIG